MGNYLPHCFEFGGSSSEELLEGKAFPEMEDLVAELGLVLLVYVHPGELPFDEVDED